MIDTDLIRQVEDALRSKGKGTAAQIRDALHMTCPVEKIHSALEQLVRDKPGSLKW